MGGFLAELGKQLAERWLSLLVLPGLLYFGALAAAYTLGHRHAFDIGQVTHQLDAWTASPSTTSTGGLVLILLATLLAATGAGLAAQALGTLTEQVWLADRWQSWPPPFRHLARSRTKSRKQRWTTANTTYQHQLDAKSAQLARRQADPPTDAGADADGTAVDPDGTTVDPDGTTVDPDEARRTMTRIAQEQPARPTWIGDRIHAVIIRLDREYHLDLPTIWPHLWLAMPETTRNEITAARETMTRAATLAGWGLLYLVVGALWWPALLIATATMGTAWRRVRTATDTYALLLEAAARLHTAELARCLGLDHTGPLTQQTGWALTCLLQGQSHLIPLTTGWPTHP